MYPPCVKRLLVENVRLAPLETEAVLPERLGKRLSVDPKAIEGLEVVRKSLDARKKPCVSPE